MSVSLLTPIAADLQISEGQVGQAIAVSGVFALISSLLISKLTARVNRRTVMLYLTSLMLISGLVVTFAPNVGIFMLGRALLGVVIGSFWALSTSIVMRLVPHAKVPTALGLLNGGNALAATIAAPVGSFLGAVMGWRGAFFCVVPIALIALFWQVKSMPSLPDIASKASNNILSLLKSKVVVYGMVGVMFLFMGQFALFTYLRPYLETVTQVNTVMLSSLLLLMGITGMLGTYLISGLLHRHLHRYLLLIPLSMAILAGGFISFGHSLLAVAGLMGLWGLIATSAPVAWNTWLSRTMAENAEIGGGLMVAIIQFGITLGASIGGVLYDTEGYQATFLLSATILILSGLSALMVWRHH